MSDLRKRNVDEGPTEAREVEKSSSLPKGLDDDTDGTDSEIIDHNAGASLPQDTGKTTEALDTALQNLSPKWRNWVVRGIFSVIMIFSFSFMVYLGPLALVLMIFFIQIKCFHEIITIGYTVYKSHDLPWFRTLSWYFLIASNYFFYGENLVQSFGVLLTRRESIPGIFIKYHRFISFALYIGGFVAFVCSLKKKYYLKQFTLFGYTHVTLLLVVMQSHLVMANIFEGLIWFLVPVSMIICNDIMAYMFGFFFGKTPLIKLSPKKTWEGFIGGAFATIIYGLIISYVLVKFDFFVCPISYNEVTESITLECERSPVFLPTEYSLPHFVQTLGKVVGRDWASWTIYPFVLHSISMSLFASVIGPFGGFFASGLKRAYKIKDFGATIPGHGGFMDRFDCQILMGVFIHVYHSSFIRTQSPFKVAQQIMTMKPEEQIEVFRFLKEGLVKRGLLKL